jgi:hypothetical protein
MTAIDDLTRFQRSCDGAADCGILLSLQRVSPRMPCPRIAGYWDVMYESIGGTPECSHQLLAMR